MILAPHEAERFYRIWFALLNYANQERQIVPDLPPIVPGRGVSSKAILPIRKAVWADDTLRQAFIAENPVHLTPADLALASSWENRISGRFFVLKHLKKYSVFLQNAQGDSPHAYGVLGPLSPLAEVVGPYLPVMIDAVLLPFEGKITYDGLIAPYSISFGPGVRADLNDTFRAAKEREGVLTTLAPPDEEPSPETAMADVGRLNAQITSAFRQWLYRSGLSPRMVEQHVSNIERFANEYMLAQMPPRLLRDVLPNDVYAYLDAARGDPKAMNALFTSFKRFLRFLNDSGRMDPGIAYDFQDFVKLFRR